MALKTFIEAIRDTMAEEMRRDASIILLGEDVGKKGGVFLATDGLWAEFGDDRVIDTPLAESMIIGTSIGAAMNGLRPIAEIQFADFIFPAFNQLVSEAARMRYRSNNGFGVPMTVRAPYGGGVHGALYHSQSVEAFFAHVPGLKVVIPSTPYDAAGLLRSSIRDDDPVLFFEHKGLYGRKGPVVRGEGSVTRVGEAGLLRAGRDVTVVATLLMADRALQAAEAIAGEGIDAEVLELRWLRPLDYGAIDASAARTGRLLVIEEQVHAGGWGASVISRLTTSGLALAAPPRALSLPDNLLIPYSPTLEDAIVPSVDAIAEAIRNLAGG